MAPSIYPFASFELKQPSVLVFPFVRRRDEEKRKWLDLSDARICGIFLSFFLSSSTPMENVVTTSQEEDDPKP